MNPNEFTEIKELIESAKEMMDNQWGITSDHITTKGYNPEKIHSLCITLVNTINKNGIPEDPAVNTDNKQISTDDDINNPSSDTEKSPEDVVKDKMDDAAIKSEIVLNILRSRLKTNEFETIRNGIILPEHKLDEYGREEETEKIIGCFEDMLNFVDTETTYKDLKDQFTDETQKMVDYFNSEEHYEQKQKRLAEQKEELAELEKIQGRTRNVRRIKELRQKIAIGEGEFDLSFIKDQNVTTKNTVDVYFDPKKSTYTTKKYYDKCNQVKLNANVFSYFLNLEEKYLEEKYHPFNNLFLFRCMRYIGTLDITESNRQFRAIVGALTKLVYDKFPNEEAKEQTLGAIRSYLDRFIEDGYTDLFIEKNTSYPKHPERLKKDAEREQSAREYYYSILRQVEHGKTDEELSAMTIPELANFAKEMIDESKKKNSDTGNLADVITNNGMNEASENTEDNESCDPAPSDEVSE